MSGVTTRRQLIGGSRAATWATVRCMSRARIAVLKVVTKRLSGWHLESKGHLVPAVSTIRRILHTAGLIEPEPRKRPRSSYHRFVAAQPNERWLLVQCCRQRSPS